MTSHRKRSDIRVVGAAVHFLPVVTRMPLKFGSATTTRVLCARARVRVRDRAGREAEGWGETPLSVHWAWPGALEFEEREASLQSFCVRLAAAWADFGARGHPIEVGYKFLENRLTELRSALILKARSAEEVMPWLAALVCCSPFDIAVHDAYGRLLERPVYETYGAEFMNHDLRYYFRGSSGERKRFAHAYPDDFLNPSPPRRLRAWHLVGGLDPVDPSELTGQEPSDGYPVLLTDWIRHDGLKCLKVKLRGDDAGWDYSRLVRVGQVAASEGVDWLSADFNCQVTEPEYVNGLLDRLRDEHPRIYGMILYVEQPFPYDLEQSRLDVHSVASRKPLFLDESAHDWQMVRLGRELGWNGVALKTCKTQTGALLSACWAKAHGMSLMVQDLTNPMLAQLAHVQLAARVGTIMGVETNAMQFYPEASEPEAAVHPGLFLRRDGVLDLSSISGPGFGYRLESIRRALPKPAESYGSL